MGAYYFYDSPIDRIGKVAQLYIQQTILDFKRNNRTIDANERFPSAKYPHIVITYRIEP